MSQQVDVALHLFELQTEIALKHGIDIGARTVQLVGEIDDMTFCHVDTALTLMEAKSKAKITIKINSDGGSVYDALAIVGRIRASSCKIITEAYGACMSAATIILAAGDKRRMSSLAVLMHHESAYGLEGTHTQMKHNILQMDRDEKLWANTMQSLTKTPASVWLERGKLGQDWYVYAEECKSLGIIDEIF